MTIAAENSRLRGQTMITKDGHSMDNVKDGHSMDNFEEGSWSTLDMNDNKIDYIRVQGDILYHVSGAYDM